MPAKLTRRQSLRLAAALSIPIAGGTWYFVNRPDLRHLISKIVQVAFGPNILEERDLSTFARDLAPIIARRFPSEALDDATDWIATLKSPEELFSTPAELKVARREAENQHGAVARYIATRFVEATDFAYDPDAEQVVYLGLYAEWPSAAVSICAPLASYHEDDGWPL